MNMNWRALFLGVKAVLAVLLVGIAVVTLLLVILLADEVWIRSRRWVTSVRRWWRARRRAWHRRQVQQMSEMDLLDALAGIQAETQRQPPSPHLDRVAVVDEEEGPWPI